MIPSRRRFSTLALSLPLSLPLSVGLAALPGGRARALPRPGLVVSLGGGGDVAAQTRGAYEAAIRDGADLIAARLFPSKDGALVARPDHDLSVSTDVAQRPNFADRRRSLTVEGVQRAGWFTEDFTLAELKSLTCGAPGLKRRAAAPGDVAGSAILTFEELVTLARAGSVKTARVVGLIAEMAHPAYFAGLDLALEPRLAGAIRVAGYNAAAAALWVASTDGDSLRSMGELTRARRLLRLDAGPPPTVADLAGLKGRAEAVAVDPAQTIDLAAPKTLSPTPLIAAVHAAGLAAQVWSSAAFPPPPYRSSDSRRLLAAVFAAGADAVAGDLAAPIARARDDTFGRDR